MSEIIRFQLNMPRELTLRFLTGKTINGQYGPQSMFTTPEGVFFVPPEVGQRIEELHLAAGSRVRIGKMEGNNGGNRAVIWCVEPAENLKPVPGHPLRSAPAESHVQNNECRNAITKPESGQAPRRHTVYSQVMAGCLIAAVDALATVQPYCDQKGMPLRFTEQNVQAIASTIFIQHCRQNGVAA